MTDNKLDLVPQCKVTVNNLHCKKILVFPMTLVTLHGFADQIYNYIRIWCTTDLSWKTFKFEDELVDILPLDDGICAYIFQNGQVSLWDVFLEQEVLALWGHTSKVIFIIHTPTGFMTISQDCTVKLWEKKECIFSHRVSDKLKCQCAIVLPDGRLVLGMYGGDILVFDIKTKQVLSLPEHFTSIMHLRSISDDKLLSQEYRGKIRIWNTTSWKYDIVLKAFDTDITNCSNIMSTLDLPSDIIHNIQSNDKLYSVGKNYLIYVRNSLPLVIIIDLVTKASKYVTLGHHCSNIMENKLIMGDIDSICIYSLTKQE